MSEPEALSTTGLLYVPTGFRCSRAEQQDFLYHRALQDQNADISRTFLVYGEESGELLGYFTIAMDAIQLFPHERPSQDIPYRRLPAVKLCQMAVHEDFEHRGHGKSIVALASSMALELRHSVGCRYLTLDAATPELVSWYKRQQFKVNKLDDRERRRLAVEANRDPLSLPTSMRLDLHHLLTDLQEHFPRDFPAE